MNTSSTLGSCICKNCERFFVDLIQCSQTYFAVHPVPRVTHSASDHGGGQKSTYEYRTFLSDMGFEWQPEYDLLGSSSATCYVCHILVLAAQGKQIHQPGYLSAIETHSFVIHSMPLNSALVDIFDCRFRIELLCGRAGAHALHWDGHHTETAQAVAADILSPEALQIVRSRWLTQCLDKHHRCSRSSGSKIARHELPSRLILVERLNESVSSVGKLSARLVTKEEILDPDGCGDFRYLTLSHAWGTEVFVTMNAHNEEEFRKNIDMEHPDFNKTFKQAIMITNSLGYRYIWIDSLCIMQRLEGTNDISDKDWKKELDHMGDIYKNSDLNLAASGFANGKTGLLTDKRKYIVPPTIATSTGMEYLIFYDEGVLKPSPTWGNWALESRGWVLQENMLAPRSLHFTNDTGVMFWECSDLLASELWPEGIPPGCRPNDTPESFIHRRKEMVFHLSLSTPGQATSSSISLQQQDFIQMWYETVIRYSRMNLTHASDTLPAIQGLADLMTKRPNMKYLCGHWEKGLLPSLLWTGGSARSGAAQPLIASSWSWATVQDVDFEVQHRWEDTDSLVAEFLGATFDNPQVQEFCRLQLRGQLYRIGTRERDKLSFSKVNGSLSIKVRSEDSIMKRWNDEYDDPYLCCRIDKHRVESFKIEDYIDTQVGSNVDGEARKKWRPVRKYEHTGALFCIWLHVDEHITHGLLLRQVGSMAPGQPEGPEHSEGLEHPVCERLGTIWRMTGKDTLQILKGQKAQELYLI